MLSAKTIFSRLENYQLEESTEMLNVLTVLPFVRVGYRCRLSTREST